MEAVLPYLKEGGFLAVAVFAILLWWRADEERKTAQRELVETQKSTATAMNNMANAIGDLRIFLGLNRNDSERNK